MSLKNLKNCSLPVNFNYENTDYLAPLGNKYVNGFGNCKSFKPS